MAKAEFYVYVHRRADTGGVFYVGKGQGSRAHSHADRNRHWRHIVEKHGRTVHILADKLTEEEAFQQEIEVIAAHRSAGVALVNMTNGGEGVSGLRRTDSAETRAKKRASAIGRRMSPEAIAKTAAFHTGRKRSPETLAKMSASLKGKNVGRKFSEETLSRLAELASARRHSDETRAKMSAKAKGSTKRPQTPEHRAKIAQKRKEYWERWRAEKTAATASTE